MIKLTPSDEAVLVNLGIIEIRFLVSMGDGFGPELMIQRFDAKWFWAPEYVQDGDIREIDAPEKKEGIVLWKSPVRPAKS